MIAFAGVPLGTGTAELAGLGSGNVSVVLVVAHGKLTADLQTLVVGPSAVGAGKGVCIS